MADNSNRRRIRLFYSYSHEDKNHRADMQKMLSMLKRQGVLQDWDDTAITPGRSISKYTRRNLRESDIIAFLLSPDFLDSEACMEEWRDAKELEETGHPVVRVPIILRPCRWQDLLKDDDIKALPTDGAPVTSYPSKDEAWLVVSDGIEAVVDELRTTFAPKPEFLTEINDSELPSSQPVLLDDIFVFPHLATQPRETTSKRYQEDVLSSAEDLLGLKRVIVHGQDKSGKTALAKHVVRTLIDRDEPVLLVTMDKASGQLGNRFLRDLYESQFQGDYDLWKQQDNKTLLVDHVTESPKVLSFIEKHLGDFDRICLFTSSDTYHAFLIDDIRTAGFQVAGLKPLTRTQQEVLIRKRLATLNRDEALADGLVDQAEDHVNSIIFSKRIVPRYPFYVLSVLHIYDTIMPAPITITSYGHCYYIFIVASLSRAGVANTDDALNSCFNFAEQLALATFLARRQGQEAVDFAAFRQKYHGDYFIETSLINRLTHKEYGIITEAGEFKTAYMYYYFLGKLLASNPELGKQHLPELAEFSHSRENHLTLLFAIHHATDNSIIDEILHHTKTAGDGLEIATLHREETARFDRIVPELSRSVLSEQSVEEERAEIRRRMEKVEEASSELPDEVDDDASMSTLRILKNNEILGQVLRNQHGRLQKDRVEEIVEVIAESSFKLVNVVLKDEDEIRKLALRLVAETPDMELDECIKLMTFISFVWTMVSIETAVHAVSVPAIREAVNAVVAHHNTPAYKILGYFCELDNAEELSTGERDSLKAIYPDHRTDFVGRVLSLRTQMYLNTHRSKPEIAQSICSVLEIQYTPRRAIGPSPGQI
ncbi:TIR domain-containing protein [Candidatus Poriferisocius sp.]|uniref:TIR domain-containing protein n=1 Tax=Candidatus Poriferisocius sp. TaxID=3101276 RepID=UPI003B02B7F3